MNIFEKDTTICGDPKNGFLRNSLFEVLEEAQGIREILGEDAYLLDSYLVEIFEKIKSVDLMTIQKIAEGTMGRLNAICYRIIDGRVSENPQNTFCEKVKSFIEEHPLPYKEIDTKLNLYSLIFIDEFINFEVENILEKFKKEMINNLSSIKSEGNFKKVSQKIEEDKIEHLVNIIKSRFIRVPLIEMFTQSILQQICTSMLERDLQTSKQMFHLLCDLKDKNNFIGGQHE